MEFFLGSMFGLVATIVSVNLHGRRIDRDIEARLMALDRERVRRIFERHSARCTRCNGRGHTSLDEQAAARDPEWSAKEPSL